MEDYKERRNTNKNEERNDYLNWKIVIRNSITRPVERGHQRGKIISQCHDHRGEVGFADRSSTSRSCVAIPDQESVLPLFLCATAEMETKRSSGMG